MYKFRKVFFSALCDMKPSSFCILSGILMGSGDLISQFCVEKKSLVSYEFRRTVRFFVFGTVILVYLYLYFVCVFI